LHILSVLLRARAIFPLFGTGRLELPISCQLVGTSILITSFLNSVVEDVASASSQSASESPHPINGILQELSKRKQSIDRIIFFMIVN